MELTIKQALQQGATAHKEGKLQDAERLYRAILQSQPAHPDANHNLGVIAVSVNKADAALPLFKTALEANPKIEQFWLSYVDALIKVKQFENAKQVLEQAKKQGLDGEKLNIIKAQLDSINEAVNADSENPSEEQLNSLLGHYQNGRLDDAEKLSISITQEFPKHQFAWKALGGVLNQLGRISESVVAKEKAVKLVPNDAEAHSNLGVTLQELGRLDEAEASYKQAIALKPDYAEAYSNLGNTFKELGRLDEALASYKQAIALKPDLAEAHNNLGTTLKELERLDEAEASYNQAIALKPDYAEAHSNLGVTLQKQGKQEEAIEAFNKVLVINPDFADAYNSMGIALKGQGNLEAAIEAYSKALAIKPDSAKAFENLMRCPFGSLSEECVNIANNFLEKFRTKIQNNSRLEFIEANYLMHNHRLDLAFDKFCDANNKKLLSKNDLEAMNANYRNFSKKLEKCQLDLAPKDSEKLTKIFILAPPRSGKSQLETLLSRSQVVKPLSDAIKLQKDFTRLTFEKLFFLDEIHLRQQGFDVVTTTNPHLIFRAMDIAEQIPNSFFIFINRDKFDVASEIFRSDWLTGHEFAYDPDNIFRLIEFYKDASETFLEKHPKNSISISFEEILFQPSSTIYRVKELCSIPCDLKQLDFTKSKIPVSSIFRKHFQAKFCAP